MRPLPTIVPRLLPCLVAMLALAAPPALAQDAPAPDTLRRDSLRADSTITRDGEPRDSADRGDDVPDAETLRLAAAFFAERRPLELSVTANLGGLRRQRGDDNPWRSVWIAYGSGDDTASLPARARTRGIFRLKLCDFPPLRLRFGRRAREGTVFEGLRRPKLVTYCKDRDEFEQYVVQEYMVYRMYEALTTVGLRARLLHATYVDSASAKPSATRYGILLEEEEQLAARLGGQILEAHGAQPHHLAAYQSVVMAIFQFMIGNTDWSVGGLHNIVLVQTQLDVFDDRFGTVVQIERTEEGIDAALAGIVGRHEAPALLEHVPAADAGQRVPLLHRLVHVGRALRRCDGRGGVAVDRAVAVQSAVGRAVGARFGLGRLRPE
jgi:hypothetical protein